MITSYQEGFEDAVELCLHEIEKSKTKDDAFKDVHSILTLLKTKKCYRLKTLINLK